MIRKMDERDIARIAELETELFGKEAWNEDIIRQELAAPSRMYIVDEDRESGDICGYAGLWFDSVDAQIMTLGVSKKYQRQHRGQRLLDELCR